MAGRLKTGTGTHERLLQLPHVKPRVKKGIQTCQNTLQQVDIPLLNLVSWRDADMDFSSQPRLTRKCQTHN